MTDLTNKFANLETLLIQQHSEVMGALSNIAGGLGAPLPTQTTTLGDIAIVLNDVVTAIKGIHDITSQYFIESAQKLSNIDTTLNLINENNSLNAQRYLLALGQLDPCKPCDPISYELPPMSANPVAIDEEHCKRMQALLYVIERLLVKLDAASSLGVGFSPVLIRDAMNEIITEINNPSILIMPSAGEIATLIGQLARYVFSNVFSNNSLVASFMNIKDELLGVLYAANSADAGKSAYETYIASALANDAISDILKTAGYRELFNMYYDSSQEFNTLAYDGTICAPVTINPCNDFDSSAITTSQPGNNAFQNVPRQAIVWPEGMGTSQDSAGFVYSADVIRPGDFYQWRVTARGGRFRLVMYSGANISNVWLDADADAFYTIPTHTTAIYLDDYQRDGAFAIELCEPDAA